LSAHPLNSLEAAIGFEPMNNGFADRCLATWLCRQEKWNLHGFVKSPSAALRFIFRHCSVLLCTLHSSRFARLASGAFYCAVYFADFLRSHQSWNVGLSEEWGKSSEAGVLSVRWYPHHSTIPSFQPYIWSGKRDSNPRQPRWQRGALPTELFPLNGFYSIASEPIVNPFSQPSSCRPPSPPQTPP
jgi:hypothetical protein